MSNTRNTRLSFFAMLLTSVAVAQAQSAQATPPSQDSGHAAEATLKVSTRLVLLDVVALDHKGQPVRDLKAEDFVVDEEGTSQKVRVFSFQQPGSTPVATDAPRLSPNMVSNIPTFKTDRTLSVLLLDGLNTDLTKQKYARQEMLKYLQRLPAGQPVAVYVLGAKLRLLQDFTTDPSLLRQAVANTRGKTSPVMDGAAAGQNAPYLPAATASAMAEMGLDAMQAQITLYQQENLAFQTDQRVLLTMAALKSLARALSGYPGRKNLIWVSSVFPEMIFTNLNPLSPANDKAHTGPVLSNYREELERISNALSNARVAVYPVDAGAVINNDVYSNMSNTDSNGNYLGQTATGRNLSGSAVERRGAMGAELDRTPDNQLSIHSSMNTVAEQTGGKAFYNRNDLDGAIRDGIEDGSVYYTLGYYPEDKNWNGKFRRISVKVNKPGLKLRYREGYFAIDPKGYSRIDPKQQAMDFGEALSLDYPLSTGMIFRAATIPPSDKSGNKLVINFGVDPHMIGFELQDDGLQHASIDCAAQAFTLKGDPVQIRGNTFNAGLKPDAYQMVMQKFLPCNQALDLKPGDYVLRLGVRDNTSGLIGTANARVTIPPPAATPDSAEKNHKPPSGFSRP